MSPVLDVNRNNLDKASSPYLRQHADNPIHWQEWSSDVLNIAAKEGKKLFVSIGYSTCHWCHVMANESFSDPEIARVLNENFISIKVDREQRPDIDHYFMMFLTSSAGGGGWPLNVFLAPDAKPIFALTYIPPVRRYGMPSMMEVLKAVQQYGEGGSSFSLSDIEDLAVGQTDLESIIENIIATRDEKNGGFGINNKFPPSSTLLFLLSYYERYGAAAVKETIEQTLTAIITRGLHDHLQGGFFRYCVDAAWTIPHFEKMLYDQAMLLWTFSWGIRTLKNKEYRGVIYRIVKCLEESFLENGLYISAHDADTLHKEGGTYIWSLPELKTCLSDDEFSYMLKNYHISPRGNFEGANHLVRKIMGGGGDVEEKLLNIRRGRPQPSPDRKIITSWNALTGVGFAEAYRAVGDVSLLQKSENIFQNLLDRHYINGRLAHSSFDGILQSEEFLQDAAALLLLATFLFEDKRLDGGILLTLRDKVKSFFDTEWFESNNPDFIRVSAGKFDHPSPSSASLATLSLLRTAILLNEPFEAADYQRYSGNEFYNLSVFISQGHWHLRHSSEILGWRDLSLNSIQINGGDNMDCFEGVCRKI